MTAFVYMIERSDGLKYIGITTNPDRRFKEHARSDRFSVGIEKVTILAETDSYEKAEDLEEEFINKYDTFENGLNVTSTGKGKNSDCKFNTLGFSFSDESKMKMSESAKKRGSEHLVNYTFTDDDKKRLSETRKGVYWGGNEKISAEISKYIYESYAKNSVDLSVDFIERFVKTSQIGEIEQLSFDDLRSKNGKGLSLKTLYCHYYAEMYNVTPANIRKIINNKGKRCPSCHDIKS